MWTKANCLWMAPEYSSGAVKTGWQPRLRTQEPVELPSARGLACATAWSAYRAGRGALLPTRRACLRNVERNLDGAEVASQKPMLLLSGGHVRLGRPQSMRSAPGAESFVSFYDDQHMGSARRT
jgi:hypothetical protein